MAGILNSKKRILDTIIGLDARRQASNGQMQLKFATFTDRHAFYQASGSISENSYSWHATDAGDRIYFEASQRYQDLITPEVDFNGKMKLTADVIVNDQNAQYPKEVGNVYIDKYSPDTLASNHDITAIQDLQLGLATIPLAESFLKQFTNNFSEQHTISSDDKFLGDVDFKLAIKQTSSDGSPVNDINFYITNEYPKITNWETSYGFVKDRELSEVDPVYRDWHWEHEPNFQFLPPINKLPPGAKMTRILPFIKTGVDLRSLDFKKAIKTVVTGANTWYWDTTLNDEYSADDQFQQLRALSYADSMQVEDLNSNDLVAAKLAFMMPYKHIYDQESAGLDGSEFDMAYKNDPFNYIAQATNKEKKPSCNIEFEETSRENNLIIQFFELTEGKLKKLSTIDWGVFENTFTPAVLKQAQAFGIVNQSMIDSVIDLNSSTRVFFVGKMYQIDPAEDPAMRYRNIFTVVF